MYIYCIGHAPHLTLSTAEPASDNLQSTLVNFPPIIYANATFSFDPPRRFIVTSSSSNEMPYTRLADIGTHLFISPRIRNSSFLLGVKEIKSGTYHFSNQAIIEKMGDIYPTYKLFLAERTVAKWLHVGSKKWKKHQQQNKTKLAQ